MKKECDEELNEISPFLADLKRSKRGEEAFKTPKFYFDNLADKVIQQANAQTSIPPQYKAQFSLLSMLKEWVAVVMQPRIAVGFASLAALLMVVLLVFQKSKSPVETFASHEEIHQYISENIDDFDETLLLEHGNLVDSDIFNAENILKEKATKDNISADEIEKYLKEHMGDTDLEGIENDL